MGEASAGWQNRSCWHQYETGAVSYWKDKSRILDEFIATIDSDRAFLDTSLMGRPSALHKTPTLFKVRCYWRT